MDKATQDYIDKKFLELKQQLDSEIPGVNKPLLIPEVSILGYNSYESRISSLETQVADHESRLDAGGL